MRPWPEEDVTILRALFGKRTNAEIAAVLGRTTRAVRTKANRLAMTGAPVPGAWSCGEDAFVRKWYEKRPRGVRLDVAGCAKALGRTRQSVVHRAMTLGLPGVRARQPDPRAPKYNSVEERHRAVGESTRRHIKENGHPRGMLGKSQTREHLAKMQEGARKWRDGLTAREKAAFYDRQVRAKIEKYGSGSPALRSGNAYSRTKSGKRPDLNGQFFRSSWEANYARFLNLLVKQGVVEGWEYEPDTFVFDKIKRGTRTYTPDFRVKKLDGGIYYVEVKGWMDKKSKTRLKRMAKYYPAVDLQLVDAKRYRALAKEFAWLPQWE